MQRWTASIRNQVQLIHLQECLDLPDEIPDGSTRVPRTQLEQGVRRHSGGYLALEMRPDQFYAWRVERVQATLEADDELDKADLVPLLYLCHVLRPRIVTGESM